MKESVGNKAQDQTYANEYGDLSLWFDSLGALEQTTQDDLPKDTEVAIIGAGFTGLWTAYYLKQQSPGLDITIVEAHTPGFGASGRNGGWCMGEIEGLDHHMRNPATRLQAQALQQEMFNTVDEVGRVCQAENIEAHYQKGGWLSVARYPFQVEQLQAHVKTKHSQGCTEDDYRWLPPDEAGQRFSYAKKHGALFANNCAVIHPARLVRGLAQTIRRMGVRIVEQTPALELQSKLVNL